MAKSLYKGSMTNIMSLFHKSPRYQVVLCDCFEWWFIKDIINCIFNNVLAINILIFNSFHFFLCWNSDIVRGRIVCLDKLIISRLNGNYFDIYRIQCIATVSTNATICYRCTSMGQIQED